MFQNAVSSLILERHVVNSNIPGNDVARTAAYFTNKAVGYMFFYHFGNVVAAVN